MKIYGVYLGEDLQLETASEAKARAKFRFLTNQLEDIWKTERACGYRGYIPHDYTTELATYESNDEFLDTYEVLDFAKYGYDEWYEDWLNKD